MNDFAGRTAVVTGAASGIGRALAFRFAAEGMNIVLADIEEPVLSETTREMLERGYSVHSIVTDVADADSVNALAKQATETYGNVHVLCNNAGVALSGGKVWERTAADWEWSFRVNVWGVIHGIRAFLPGMLAHGEAGHIVNTASMAGLTPNLLGVYSVTKGAVVSISEFLYRNLQEENANLGCSVLCPGYVQTRIGTSARNRHRNYRNPRGSSSPSEARFHSNQVHLVGGGQEPEEVAEAALEAIRTKRFWILTDHGHDVLLKQYWSSILTGSNPSFSEDDI